MKSITINGTGYHVANVAKLSFEEFKKDGENSYAKDVSDTTLQEIYNQLIEAAGIIADDEKNEQLTAKSAKAALKSGLPVQIVEAVATVETENLFQDGDNSNGPKEAASKAAGSRK